MYWLLQLGMAVNVQGGELDDRGLMWATCISSFVCPRVKVLAGRPCTGPQTRTPYLGTFVCQL